MRDGARRLGPALASVAAVGVAVALVGRPASSHSPADSSIASQRPAAQQSAGRPAAGQSAAGQSAASQTARSSAVLQQTATARRAPGQPAAGAPAPAIRSQATRHAALRPGTARQPAAVPAAAVPDSPAVPNSPAVRQSPATPDSAAQHAAAAQIQAPLQPAKAAGQAGPAADAAAGQTAKSWPAAAAVPLSGRVGAALKAVQVASSPAAEPTPAVAPLRKLRPADLLVVAPTSLPPAVAAQIRRLPGVTAAEPLDAATIKVNGKFVQMLGVNPGAFRAFAAGPTARSTSLWRSVAGGAVAVSYTMGKQDKLPLGGSVSVAGRRPETLRVGGYGTVGIAGVDAVVSDAVARTLGLPVSNALVISAPHASLVALAKRIKADLPHRAGIAQLVLQVQPGVAVQAAAAGAAGATSPTAGSATAMTPAQVQAFLKAAISRVGLPYIWGAAGPQAFDCSGLVQWSLRQAGIVMPRVAADQARTGPRVALSQLAPGDLIFYHTDATAPTYISHVAIYLGHGLMLQAPEPGMNVQIVQADFGAGFAGAVQVAPAIAAAVAGNPAG